MQKDSPNFFTITTKHGHEQHGLAKKEKKHAQNKIKRDGRHGLGIRALKPLLLATGGALGLVSGSRIIMRSGCHRALPFTDSGLMATALESRPLIVPSSSASQKAGAPPPAHPRVPERIFSEAGSRQADWWG